jgi:hypothetical protein
VALRDYPIEDDHPPGRKTHKTRAVRVNYNRGVMQFHTAVAITAAALRPIAILGSLAGMAAIAAGFGQAPLSDSYQTVAGRDSTPSSAPDSVTRVSMRNVNFFIIPGAALRIRTLRGTMNSLRGGPIVFDDKSSFVINLAYAEIGLNGNDITTLMNQYIFAYPGAPLKKLKIHTSGSQLIQTGVMHKIIDIPFEITANLSMTPEGFIRIHTLKTRILGIDGNGLMRAFNLTLEKILDLSKAKGVTVKGNDLFLDPVRILPPPAITGHATAIRIEGDEMVQTFGHPADVAELVPPDTSPPAYMFYKGGTLHFGKLLMLDAEMQIVDRKPTGWFSFDLDRYKEQLVAGYERTLPDMGLEVYMLGLEKLGTTAARQLPDSLGLAQGKGN